MTWFLVSVVREGGSSSNNWADYRGSKERAKLAKGFVGDPIWTAARQCPPHYGGFLHIYQSNQNTSSGTAATQVMPNELSVAFKA